jgi:hypothetical protein
MTLRAAALRWTAAAGSLVACRQIVGFQENPSGQPDAESSSVCGLPYGTGECASCAAASCCRESSACASIASCVPYAACVGACRGDPQCRAKCEVDHPPGISSEGSALAACLVRSCDSPCGLTCGAQLYGVTPDVAAPCQVCITRHACSIERACAASAECDSVARCRVECGFSFDCFEACYTARGLLIPGVSPDAGTGAGNGVYSGFPSVTPACDPDCGSGANWGCVRSGPQNNFGPKPRSTSFAFSLEVRGYDTTLPLPGVDVSVCQGGIVSDSCATLAGPVQTDDGGLVTFQVPQLDTVMPFAGYVQIASSTLIPILWNFGFPVSEANLSLVGTLGFFAPTPAAAASIAQSLNVTQDGALGAASIQPRDCLGVPAPGVLVTMSGNHPIAPIYNFSLSAIETGGTTVDAYFPNVPPGIAEFTVTPKATGVRSNTVKVLIRAGTLTRYHANPPL